MPSLSAQLSQVSLWGGVFSLCSFFLFLSRSFFGLLGHSLDSSHLPLSQCGPYQNSVNFKSIK